MWLSNRSAFIAAMVLVVFLGIVTSLNFQKRPKSCSRFNCLSMENLHQFKIKNIYRDDNYVYSALFINKNNLLRVYVASNISLKEANKAIDGQIAQIKALFADSPVPYPGDISDRIVCDKSFIPEFTRESVGDIKISYFIGFLSPRLTFGVCIDDQAYYKGVLALFYCLDHKKMYQLEIIAPKDDFNTNSEKYLHMLRSIRCKT